MGESVYSCAGVKTIIVSYHSATSLESKGVRVRGYFHSPPRLPLRHVGMRAVCKVARLCRTRTRTFHAGIVSGVILVSYIKSVNALLSRQPEGIFSKKNLLSYWWRNVEGSWQ